MDGVTFLVPVGKEEDFKKVNDEWEVWSKMMLEYAEYEKIIQPNINNYIWIPKGFDYASFNIEDSNCLKKVKLKGLFEIERDWHKNHSMKIVQKALANYFVKGIPVETTIKQSTDVFDFFKVCKAKSNFKIEYWKYDKQGVKTITPMHKITRYLISNNGGQLMKVMPPIKTVADTETEKFRKTHPQQSNMFDFIEDVLVIPDRESNVEAGYLTTIHNKITSTDIKDYDINYDYYINECNKVIKAVEGNLKFEIEEDDSEQLDLFED